MVIEKEFEENLTNYLKNNGIEEIPSTNKEKLQLLKNIVFNSRVNIDCADLKHSKDVAAGIKDEGFLENIQNLEVNVHNGLYYIANIRGIVKEERKLERKTKIKKILGMK